MPHILRSGIVAVALVCAAAGPGAAQGGQDLVDPAAMAVDRSGRGDQTLDIVLSTLDAYDDGLLAATSASTTTTGPQRSGPYYGVQAGIAYAKRTRRAVFELSEGSALRYYPTLTSEAGAYHAGTAGLALQFSRTRLTLKQTAVLSPFYFFDSYPAVSEQPLGALPVSATEPPVAVREQRLFGSQVDLEHSIGRHTALSVTSTFQNVDFLNDGGGLRDLTVGAHLSHQFTRAVALSLGFTNEQGTYWTAQSTPRQTTIFRNLDLGLSYRHTLPFARKTTFEAATGLQQVHDEVGQSEYRVVASGRLSHPFGRTWQTTAAVSRGTRFIAGFQQPFFADSVVLSLGGALGRRARLEFSGGYSTDQLVATGGGSGTDLYDTSARLTMPLSRKVSLTGEYLFYRYRFGRADMRPLGLPPDMKRNAIRIGLDVWLPVIY